MQSLTYNVTSHKLKTFRSLKSLIVIQMSTVISIYYKTTLFDDPGYSSYIFMLNFRYLFLVSLVQWMNRIQAKHEIEKNYDFSSHSPKKSLIAFRIEILNWL